MQTVTYNDKEKINKVVDSLVKKGLEIFNSVNDITIIEEGDFRLKGIEIYNSASTPHAVFVDECPILSTISGINRAIYILIDANSQIPNHLDDDDHSYRIVTGVITSKNTKVNVLDLSIDLTFKRTIGFDATNTTHNATNFTSEPCTMLIVCLNNNPFNSSNLLEVLA
jgi:hypothetical protein